MIAAYVLALMMWAQQPALRLCSMTDNVACIENDCADSKGKCDFSYHKWDFGKPDAPLQPEALQPACDVDAPNCIVGGGRPLVIFKAATPFDHMVPSPWPPQAEAIDVPAVQVASTSGIVMRGDITTCSNHGTLTITQSQNECANGFAWTCDDKSRGLWHSEDGHYWCHKAQPEASPQPSPMHCGPAIVWPSDDLSDESGQKVRICYMEESQ